MNPTERSQRIKLAVWEEVETNYPNLKSLMLSYVSMPADNPNAEIYYLDEQAHSDLDANLKILKEVIDKIYAEKRNEIKV